MGDYFTLVIRFWSNPKSLDQIQHDENYRNHKSKVLVVVGFGVDYTSVKLRLWEFVFHEEAAGVMDLREEGVDALLSHLYFGFEVIVHRKAWLEETAEDGHIVHVEIGQIGQGVVSIVDQTVAIGTELCPFYGHEMFLVVLIHQVQFRLQGPIELNLVDLLADGLKSMLELVFWHVLCDELDFSVVGVGLGFELIAGPSREDVVAQTGHADCLWSTGDAVLNGVLTGQTSAILEVVAIVAEETLCGTSALETAGNRRTSDATGTVGVVSAFTGQAVRLTETEGTSWHVLVAHFACGGHWV